MTTNAMKHMNDHLNCISFQKDTSYSFYVYYMPVYVSILDFHFILLFQHKGNLYHIYYANYPNDYLKEFLNKEQILTRITTFSSNNHDNKEMNHARIQKKAIFGEAKLKIYYWKTCTLCPYTIYILGWSVVIPPKKHRKRERQKELTNSDLRLLHISNS